MSQLDLQALEANFKAWKSSRFPDLPVSDAFEIYAVDQVLKDADLSDEDILSGNFGSGDDGGVDAMYFFVNQSLMRDDSPMPSPALEAELVIIQAKGHNGYGEKTVQLLESFANDLLDYTKDVDTLTYLNSQARDAMKLFRNKYDLIMGDAPELKISFHYVTKTIGSVNPKVNARVLNLKSTVAQKCSHANVAFEFWGCARLLDARRRGRSEVEILPITAHFGTSDGSVVCLVRLTDFAKLLTDDTGNIKSHILEANVRDYQGKNRAVNEDIRATLQTVSPKENFWWLNNGITVLAEQCSVSAQKITIKRPEIVNGLQTSYEIYNARSHLGPSDPRAVLLRIIATDDEGSKNSIIKATNSQTPVSPLSLRATEKIHFDIEDRLLLYDLFYDRKKGKYKHLGKPAGKIVSMRTLAQSVMTVLLHLPDDARARPQTATDNEQLYGKMFDPSYNIDLFVVCTLLDRQIDAFLSAQSLTFDEKRNLKYYILMLVSCDAAKKRNPTPADVAALLNFVRAQVAYEELEAATGKIMAIYVSQGANDRVAKSGELKALLQAEIDSRLP